MSDPGAEQHFLRLAARAETLAQDDPLRFAAQLLHAQASMAAQLAGLTGSLQRDLFAVRGAAEPLVAFVRSAAPEPPGPLNDEQLLGYWQGVSLEDWLARTVLQPYLAALRFGKLSHDRPRPDGRCPYCGGLPWVASREPEAVGDGARRMLHCSLCAFVWQVNRIRCAACGEENPEKLPVFNADEHQGARIEACETCQAYVKSIDRTDDARRLPEVDDLVSLGLDLWAQEQGFTRIEPGLLWV